MRIIALIDDADVMPWAPAGLYHQRE